MMSEKDQAETVGLIVDYRSPGVCNFCDKTSPTIRIVTPRLEILFEVCRFCAEMLSFDLWVAHKALTVLIDECNELQLARIETKRVEKIDRDAMP
jgi:hypothetical protein